MIVGSGLDEATCKKIGDILRAERERQELTRQQLAENIGVEWYFVRQIEYGEFQRNVPMMVQVAEGLGYEFQMHLVKVKKTKTKEKKNAGKRRVRVKSGKSRKARA